MAAIWWKKANRTGGLSAMAAGLAVWGVSSWLAPDLPGMLLGMFASLIAMLSITPLSQRSDPPKPLLTSDGRPLELEHRLGILHGHGADSR